MDPHQEMIAALRGDEPVLTRGSVEYAEWLADKLHNTNDYGKEAAGLLVRQARELQTLREQCARVAEGAIDSARQLIKLSI